MKNRSEIKYFFKVIKSRFKGLRKELKILLILSFFSILISELFLNNYSSFHQIQFSLGVIYIKVCYSYLSAFIFYYLVVYSPKERKRVKAFRLLNNKIHSMNNYINGILLTIINVSDSNLKEVPKELSYKEIDEYCKKVNPNLPVKYYHTEVILHNDYYDFMKFKTEKIKSIVSEIIVLHDLLDDNLFLNFSNINDIATNRLNTDYKIFKYNNMDFNSHGLYDLYFERNELWNNFLNFRKRYEFQYHKAERQRNLRRKL